MKWMNTKKWKEMEIIGTEMDTTRTGGDRWTGQMEGIGMR